MTFTCFICKEEFDIDRLHPEDEINACPGCGMVPKPEYPKDIVVSVRVTRAKELLMKAWFVWIMDEWGDYVHGETPGKAKSMFWKEWGDEADEWINLRPIRIPDLDNIPLTRENIAKYQGKRLLGDQDDYGNWWPICDCSVCKPEDK